jgi:hypothetical protein
MMNQGEMWLKEHNCLDEEEDNWDDEEEWNDWDDEEEWNDWDDEEEWNDWDDEYNWTGEDDYNWTGEYEYYGTGEDNYMPEFNSTEDLYWFFIQHVEMNCSHHYYAAQMWADDLDETLSVEDMYMQGEKWLEEHGCLDDT